MFCEAQCSLFLYGSLIHKIVAAVSVVFIVMNINRKVKQHFYINPTYRVIHNSLRDFRRDGHAEGEHVNRGRDTPSFCPTLQLLDMSTLGDDADVNSVIKFLPHTLQHLVVDSSDCLHDPL
jgi:hypothetical protein